MIVEAIVLLVLISIIRSVMESQKAKEKSIVKEIERKNSSQNAANRQRETQSTTVQENEETLSTLLGNIFEYFKKVIVPETTSPKPKTKAAEAKTEYRPPQKTKTTAQGFNKGSKEQLKPHVKPHQTSLTPIKNAHENAQPDTHRIELNPNIHQRKTNETLTPKTAIEIKTDPDTIIQSLIWSEVLAKPKALRR